MRYFAHGEHEEIVKLAKSVDPERMIEIGCNEGQTAAIMLREIPTLKEYIGVDVPPSYTTSLPIQQKEIPKEPGHLCKDSRFKLLLLPMGSFDLDPNSVSKMDVVFIDGDHGADAVRNDSLLAWAMVRKGGIVIWHDYNNPLCPVTEVLDKYKRDGHDIRHIDGTRVAYERT